jgi:hypothetical protein
MITDNKSIPKPNSNPNHNPNHNPNVNPNLNSQIFPHIVPGLIRPLSPSHKKHVPLIFLMALLTTSIIYILVGCICVIYFREDINPSVNLNFVNFSDRLVSDNSAYKPVFSLLAMVVVLFPALDTLSVFPLVANTLGNNLNVAFPFLKKVFTSGFDYYDNNKNKYNQNDKDHRILDEAMMEMNKKERKEKIRKATIIAWRLGAAIPPVICCSFVNNLSITLQIAG